ncbi:MAG: phospholipase D-like domain-containing protein [Acidobacteriota bacterium]
MASEQVFIEPAARRRAVLGVIAGARERLVMSLFRCTDAGVLDALAGALGRGVRVEAILTKRAKGGKKRLRKLWATLESMGVVVHRYGAPVVKYHAKYIVADGRVALVTTLNPTRKCFSETWDFVLTTTDRHVVRSLCTLFALDASGSRLLPRHRMSPRLIVGPDGARARIRALIASARQSIFVLDHKLSDPAIVELLRKRRGEGISVLVVGRQPIRATIPHGKMIIVDEARAVLGSLALSTFSLDLRREVSILVDEPKLVGALTKFYRGVSRRAGRSTALLPGDRAA